MMARDFESWDAWRDAIEPDLAAVVTSDLTTDGADVPRIVFDTEVGAPKDERIAGLAGEMFFIGYADVIARRVPGAKPGPVLYIHTNGADRDFPDPEERFAYGVATASHELAHWFDFRSLRGYTPKYAKPETIQRLVRESVCEDASEDHDIDEVHHAKQGIDHGRFVRRTVHISYRMIERGWKSPLIYLQNWGDVQPWDAFRALGDELERLQGLTIREVDRIDPPAEFSALFAAAKVEAA